MDGSIWKPTIGWYGNMWMVPHDNSWREKHGKLLCATHGMFFTVYTWILLAYHEMTHGNTWMDDSSMIGNEAEVDWLTKILLFNWFSKGGRPTKLHSLLSLFLVKCIIDLWIYTLKLHKSPCTWNIYLNQKSNFMKRHKIHPRAHIFPRQLIDGPWVTNFHKP